MKKLAIGILVGIILSACMAFTFTPSGSSSSVDVKTFVTEIEGHEYAAIITSTRGEYGYIRTSVSMTHHAGCKACGEK